MRRLQLSAALAALVLHANTGCDESRDRPTGLGVHPAGWADNGSPSFHGDFLRDQGYPLAECRACHGADFAGGDSGVSCSDSGGCHTSGVADCSGTCHGSELGPRPVTDSHDAHSDFCQACHPVPTGLTAPHVDGTVDLQFGGLAIAAGAAPEWDPASATCSNTYCHVGDSPAWDSDAELSCDGCHSQSPTHDRFDRVVEESTCAGCHGGSPATGHLDGTVVVSVTQCDGCHGVSAATGAPPPGLDGSTDPASAGVGAHRRHLDSLAPGRIGKVVACRRCHAVPEKVMSPGHLDSTAPADVDVVLGSYDPATQRCVVDCHWDRDPGPTWTDDSGAARACDACHAFPPVLTRTGTRHPPTPADLAACSECHSFAPTTHVDGEVTFQ